MSGADDNAIDDPVDEEIYSYLDIDRPRSFLLFAGAGSGKTRSLVTALERIRSDQSRKLWLRRQRIRVITYTNAACDEINKRLRFDPLVEVSTIHSFAWSLIGTFQSDIREWLRVNLAAEIADLEVQAQKGRAGTKAAIDREISMASKRRRLASLDEIRTFSYSPTSDNRGRDALNHSEVIAMTAAFLSQQNALAGVLTNQYPILLIDESQDTNRHLMDALMSVEASHSPRFCLGLFGDAMQRIYADGKVGLDDAIPKSWARPAKVMNHRCPERVVALINQVRSAVDRQQQKARTDKAGGTVRLFALPSSTLDKPAAEKRIAARMAELTGDAEWSGEAPDYKTLTLEHHMAARRAGFLELFQALYAAERLRTGLLDGSLPALGLFVKDILPLVQAWRVRDEFGMAAVVRQRSPILSAAALKAAGKQQPELLQRAQKAVDHLVALWRDEGANPRFVDVLSSIVETGLFDVPEVLRNILVRDARLLELEQAKPEEETSKTPGVDASEEEEGEEEKLDDVIHAWDEFLRVPFSQIEPYAEYVSGTARSATHQGVKGLEFPRVVVVMDDEEARGFLFSYGKFFGATPKSTTDVKNEQEGNETTIDRTRRLFYVTCSRAEKSLAVVAYSSDPDAVLRTALAQGWFKEDEIEVIRP